MISVFYLVALHLLLVPHCCFVHLEGGQFPCTDDCQVTFVNLKCDSSKKRRRGRKSPTKEVSHITAEFEMEMKEEEASGVMFFSSCYRKSLMMYVTETRDIIRIWSFLMNRLV